MEINNQENMIIGVIGQQKSLFEKIREVIEKGETKSIEEINEIEKLKSILGILPKSIVYIGPHHRMLLKDDVNWYMNIFPNVGTLKFNNDVIIYYNEDDKSGEVRYILLPSHYGGIPIGFKIEGDNLL